MPDLLEIYEQDLLKEKEDQEKPTEGEIQTPIGEQSLDTFGEERLNLSGSATGNAKANKAQINQAYSDNNLGPIAGKNTRDLFEDPNSWSPAYSDKGFVEEVGTSLMRGIGNHFIKGTGDMLQTLGALFSKDLVDGTMLSRALQESGTEFADRFKSYLPEDIKAENITWSSLMNPKFWSVHVAEMMPQLAEFILLSKGGSALARRGLKQIGKANVGGVLGRSAQIANKRTVFKTGKGLAGKLVTEGGGITKLGEQIAGAIGGGIAGNAFSGLLNSAEVINSNKDLLDDKGERVFTDEDLREMAASTMKNNAAWVGIDMVSWGMTFGGGWKALRGMNPVSKGAKTWTKGQQSKIIGKMFAYNVSPMVKRLGKLAGKAAAEGFEEQYQESWEEWAKMKAISKKTGVDDSDLLALDDFYTFFTSKENEATRVLSAAVGALGGGIFNVKDLFNKSADDSYRIYDRTINLSEIVNKQGSEEALGQQEFFINQSISDLVVDDREDLYEELVNSFVENGNITEEEQAGLDDIYNKMKDANAKVDRLNVKGKEALMHNVVVQNTAEMMIEGYKAKADQNIADIKADEGMSENDKIKEIEKIEAIFDTELKAAAILLAEAQQNQANLILGKKVDPLSVETITNKYGQQMVIGGLSNLQFYKYTTKGETDKAGYTYAKLKDTGKSIYDKIVSKGRSTAETVKEKVKDFKESKTGEKVKETVEKVVESEVVKKAKEKADEIVDKVKEKIKGEPTKEETAEAEETAKAKQKKASEQKAKVGKTFKAPEEKTPEVTDKDITDKALNIVADLINEEKELTPVQEQVRQLNEENIQRRIVKKILSTPKKTTRKESIIDDLSKKDLDEIKDTHKVDITRTDKGFEVVPTISTDKRTKAYKDAVKAATIAVEEKVLDNLTKIENEVLSAKEKEFVKDEAINQDDTGETLDEAVEEENRQATQNFKADKEAVTDAAEKLDKRTGGGVKQANIAQATWNRQILHKIRNRKRLPSNEHISKNELDNYLNQFTTYNLKGPANIHKMAVVNHNLKNMFPNMSHPPQVMITKNLLESVGSIGLGTVLGLSIFIDEKAWNQDSVFMHEMSHIYYQLSQDSPETQKLVKAALSNKELVNRIKKLYPDYVQYVVHTVTGPVIMTKGQINKEFIQGGIDMNSLEGQLAHSITNGDVETIPLSKQKYIVEEMFVAQLEGNLSQRFDKVFNTKNEVQRQKDTRIWWGLIRKRGAVIEANNNVDRILQELFDKKQEDSQTMENFFFETFKAVTKGITIDTYSLDNRVDEANEKDLQIKKEIIVRYEAQKNNPPEDVYTSKDNQEEIDEAIIALEEDNQMFYDDSFGSRVKKATRILRRFGMVYNRTLRARKIIRTKGDVINRNDTKLDLFNRDRFETRMYQLALENNDPIDFIKNIENSTIKEIKSFNRFLKKMFPETDLQILNSMHYVLSNSKHIVGHKNTINAKNEYDSKASLSHKERNQADSALAKMFRNFQEKTLENGKKKGNQAWHIYQNAVNRIYKAKVPSTTDIKIVVDMMTTFDTAGLYNGKIAVFKGITIPLETLIVGYIKKGMLFNKNDNGDSKYWNWEQDANGKWFPVKEDGFGVYSYAARPIVEALINTNRQYTPYSVVQNAEGNMEPVKIVNNHLTKEVDNMIEFLAPDENGKEKTKEEFIARYSHINDANKIEKTKGNLVNPDGTKHIVNSFLDQIYDDYKKGIMPTISQYHGIEDVFNKKGSVYKGSTSLEQGIEDFMTYIRSTHKPRGGRSNLFLANIGTFSDSPRKFFMNTRRIAYDEAFNPDGSFIGTGAVMNSIWQLHKNMNPGDPNADKKSAKYREWQTANKKSAFNNDIRKAIKETIAFIESNYEQLNPMKVRTGFTKKAVLPMAAYFLPDGKLNKKGQIMAAEYAMNTIVAGYNMAEVFLPNVKGSQIVKRFKMNSSPIMSIKNPNLKLEPIYFADEIIKNLSISGTDSAMYILEEDAKKWQDVGKGVFELNSGFKFLNASVEKDNPNFKGKAAYLKGYTTIVDKTHPLYKIMKARKDKYNTWHLKKHGVDPSSNYTDQTPNHILIAIPQSSDKTGFFQNEFTPEEFIKKRKDENGKVIKNDVTGQSEIEYTEQGALFTEQALSENIDDVMKIYDKLYYDKNGDFIGIDAYNFGPQQIMDKKTEGTITPVQLINNIIVGASNAGHLKEAYEIQNSFNKQKQKNLQKVVSQLELSKDDEAAGINKAKLYKNLIDKGLNKQEMDQAQRILFEETDSSIANPYLVEIITNQLSKTLRQAGNRLPTTGAYSHQKPDSGWRAQSEENKALNSYNKNGDGSTNAAEIIVSQDLNDGSVEARQPITRYNTWGKRAIKHGESALGTMQKKEFKKLRATSFYLADNILLENAAITLAVKRHNVTREEAYKYIGKEHNKNDEVIGYHVKGDTVIATRVPSSKPGDTGIFEIVGFHEGEGNQVSVSSDMNDIFGSDNDGDTLFIQTKTKKKGFENWNNGLDGIIKLWLSPAMREQITNPMIFEENTEKIVEKVNEVFPGNNDYIIPFSPRQRMIDYDNTMVAKRNVGPVFNIHKVTNMFASVNIPITRSIKIGTTEYGSFSDEKEGNDSRNLQSAILANIILDNAKHGFADSLGLNQYNIAQAVLMVNLGIPLEQVGLILNSPAARVWARLNRNSNSMFHENLSKSKIIEMTFDIITEANHLHTNDPKGKNKKIEDYLKEAFVNTKKNKHRPAKRPEETNTNLEINKIALYSQQNNILEIMSYLADMNTDIQALGTILGGHKKIHVNPLVLEQQIKNFKNVLAGKSEKKTFQLNDDFKSNPDMQNYLDVAEETLTHLQTINPIYRNATNGAIESLTNKISGNLTDVQIEEVGADILLFNTSRLLGHNNLEKNYVQNLMKQKHKDSVYSKLDFYFQELQRKSYNTEKDLAKAFSDKDNSLLFTQAMNYDLTSTSENGKYISANSQFTNNSFSEPERNRARDEFAQLPSDLQNALMVYDLIQHGWKGPLSLAPYFSRSAMNRINFESNIAMNTKNTEVISSVVINKLERNIALKLSRNINNPFKKHWVKNSINLSSEKEVINTIFYPKTKKDEEAVFALTKSIMLGQPMYINILSKNPKTKVISNELYEIDKFTDEEIGMVTSENNMRTKRDRIAQIAETRMKHIPNTLSENPNIDIANIADKNVFKQHHNYTEHNENASLDYLSNATVVYEQGMKALREGAGQQTLNLDAREDYWEETFTREVPLNYAEYRKAMEFQPYVSEGIKTQMYDKYIADKKRANLIVSEKAVGEVNPLKNLENQSTETLLKNYEEYAERDVYAYSVITTPIVKQLTRYLIADQAELFKKNEVTGKEQGSDISKWRAFMMSGSTVPSNHPASQAMARMLEKEYKNFINEKKKYTSRINKVTEALYQEKLGYGGKGNLYSLSGLRNLGLRIKDAIFSNRAKVYNQLYGNMVIREEFMNDQGKLVINYKLRPQSEIDSDVASGFMTKAEKDFYDTFRAITTELKPPKVKELQDYIPHTSMNKLEKLSTRGMLGLLANSRTEEHAMQDVKMIYAGNLMTWKHIEDHFKMLSAGDLKNNTRTVLEFRKLKQKAKKLFKSGKNEDGSKILTSAPFVETALGFGAINRFANHRSIKATELPSMDLNKALGDYIHSTLFVNGNSKFRGMEKLGAYIDGVLAWNEENNLPNMNIHIKKVWKDYFLRQKRQTSFLGPTTDRVILGLTRLNLFYALGYSANVNTGGLYAIGNVLAGKYHNIKDIGAGAWLKGESRFWGLDKGFGKGIGEVNKRRKRMARIMKTMNFLDINVYDEVSMEKGGGLDRVFSDIALSPMIYSEKWIQQVHMLGLLTDRQLELFDEDGNYKDEFQTINPEDLVRLEDQVKSSHGRGYQPTDQRAIQMYSWGNMMLQFSRFIPTMVHDRFAKEDVNIYGRETIGTMTAVGKALRFVLNNPKEFVSYRKSLTKEQRRRLDSGLKGVGMAAVIAMLATTSGTASSLFWDVNYYWNYPKLTSKLTPAPVRSINGLMNGLF